MVTLTPATPSSCREMWQIQVLLYACLADPYRHPVKELAVADVASGMLYEYKLPVLTPRQK
jgi:hypothetical protein